MSDTITEQPTKMHEDAKHFTIPVPKAGSIHIGFVKHPEEDLVDSIASINPTSGVEPASDAALHAEATGEIAELPRTVTNDPPNKKPHPAEQTFGLLKFTERQEEKQARQQKKDPAAINPPAPAEMSTAQQEPTPIRPTVDQSNEKEELANAA